MVTWGQAAWADKWWVKRRKDGVLSIVTARALGYYVPEKLHAARWVRCLPSADVPPLEVVKSPVGWLGDVNVQMGLTHAPDLQMKWDQARLSLP